MFSTPDIPQAPEKEFSEEEYQEELTWLRRKKEGKIQSSSTDGGWVLAVGSAALIAFIIGGVIGVLIAILTKSNIALFIPGLVIFLISLYFLKGDFSVVEIDPERQLLFYEGTISIGGEYRSTRYRGPIEVVERTMLVRFKRPLGLKSKPFIRFMTRSGYMRVNFNPEVDIEFLRALNQVGLVNIDDMKASINKKPVRNEETYVVLFQKDFDRTAFKEELKRKREAEKHQEKIEKKIRRQKLIEKSKKYRETDGDNDSSKINID